MSFTKEARVVEKMDAVVIVGKCTDGLYTAGLQPNSGNQALTSSEREEDMKDLMACKTCAR